ncbi:alpha-D-ribose 1-methylphosphonate 5-triphosphate diphosphatase [Magnetospira thiophila]
MPEQIFTNARMVLADRVITGSLVVTNGLIRDISETPSRLPGALDLEGDYLMPGFIELHTDNLEKHMTPRPKTDWPTFAAVIAHDSQVAVSGITTVFDALALGDVNQGSTRIRKLGDMIKGIGDAADDGLLRAEHFLHLRCEVSYPELPEALDGNVGNPRVRMLSVMDHTPGQRQFAKLEAYYIYYQGKYGMSDSDMEIFIADRRRDQQTYGERHRRHVVAAARQHGLALASHDDATPDHVAEAVADGMTVAEFPTTVEAARAAHQAGLHVLMGGPNIVRGGSHSGNVSARDLAAAGILDVISSDYVPHSLLHGAMLLFDDMEAITLPQAIAMITRHPAESVGLTDRGEIAIGKRADLVHVHHSLHHPVVRAAWSQGRRIA